MKNFLTVVVLAAPLVGDTAVAQGNKLDLVALKCRELFELKWSRFSEQIFRIDKWSLCQG
jgi:hypothetical protein